MRLVQGVLCAFLTVPAFATEMPAPCPDCDLERLVRTCHELEDNEQIREFETKVFCSGNKTTWETQGEEALNIATKFNVANELTMKGDRYRVPSKTFGVASLPSAGSCNIYREMMITVPTIQNTFHSCADLDQFAALGRAEYCRRVINQRLDEDPIDGVATGKVLNTCDGSIDVNAIIGASFEPASVSTSHGTLYGMRVSNVSDPKALIGKNNLVQGDIVLNINENTTENIDKLNNNVILAKINHKELEILYFQKSTNKILTVKTSI